MKKILIIIGICALLISMPAFSAFSVKTISEPEQLKSLKTPIDEEYDGTFVSGLGQVWKEDDEWKYEVYSYIAGVYRDHNYKILYGNIYNLEEEQIEAITMISFRFFFIGRITDMEDHKAPIVGFMIDYDEDNFIGRLMSFFGPAPHMWGQYIPN